MSVCVRAMCACVQYFYSCVSKILEVNKHIMNTCIVNSFKRSHHLLRIIAPINMSDAPQAI